MSGLQILALLLLSLAVVILIWAMAVVWRAGRMRMELDEALEGALEEGRSRGLTLVQIIPGRRPHLLFILWENGDVQRLSVRNRMFTK